MNDTYIFSYFHILSERMSYYELSIGRRLRGFEIYRILMNENQRGVIIEVTNGREDYEIVIDALKDGLDIKARRIVIARKLGKK